MHRPKIDTFQINIVVFFFLLQTLVNRPNWQGVVIFGLRQHNKFTFLMKLPFISSHLSQKHYPALDKKAMSLLMNSINKNRSEGYMDVQY